MAFVEATFTASDGTNILSYTGETGATFTRATGTNTGRSAYIASNRLRGDVDGFIVVMQASGTPASADYTVEGVVTHVALTSGRLDLTGVAARIQSGANTSYQAFAYENDNAPRYRVDKVVAGARTVLLDVAATFGTDTFELVLSGTTLTLYADGVQVGSPITDSSISGAGKAGTVTRFSTATTGYHLDSITATDAGGGATTHQGTASASQGQTATTAATRTTHATATATQAQSATTNALVTRHATASGTQGQIATTVATRTAHGVATASQAQTATTTATLRMQATASASQAQTGAADGELVGAAKQGTASATQGQAGATVATLRLQGSASASQAQTGSANGTIASQAHQGSSSGVQAQAGAVVAFVTKYGAATGVQGVTAATLARLTMQATASGTQGQIATTTAGERLPTYGTVSTTGHITSATAVVSHVLATTTTDGSQ